MWERGTTGARETSAVTGEGRRRSWRARPPFPNATHRWRIDFRIRMCGSHWQPWKRTWGTGVVHEGTEGEEVKKAIADTSLQSTLRCTWDSC